jgi:hypothetical protein
MAQGYEFSLSNGETLQLVPNDIAKMASISHGDLKIEVKEPLINPLRASRP